jgi:hypothetical protein
MCWDLWHFLNWAFLFFLLFRFSSAFLCFDFLKKHRLNLYVFLALQMGYM